MLGPSDFIGLAYPRPLYMMRNDSLKKWMLRYGFPPIRLLVGNKKQTDELISKLKEKNIEVGRDMEFRPMTMHEFIQNNNNPIPSPKGKDGGYILLDYQAGLTDLTIYDLSKYILMKKNEEENPYERMNVEQNLWPDRDYVEFAKKQVVKPWIRTGWNLIVVVDYSFYNPLFDSSKGFYDNIYKELARKDKWVEYRAFDIP
jgi:hypothetical protein